MSTTPRTDAARGFHDMDTAVSAEDMAQLETEFAVMQARAELAEAGVERLKGYCEQLHTIIDNKLFPSGTDYAKMTARAELAEASAKLWEADALRYANNTEFWKDRAEKAEAELARLREELAVANNWAEHHAARGNDLIAENINHAEAAIRSERLWKEFITLMDITEESDSGYAFNPNKISSCRAIDGKRLNEILNEARQIVFKQ